MRARKVTPADFARFDLILAMDRGHFADLEALRPKDARAQVRLFLATHPDSGRSDVPDPYYGGPAGFAEVLDIIESGSRNLLAEIRTRYIK